jgi:hypothetical protein
MKFSGLDWSDYIPSLMGTVMYYRILFIDQLSNYYIIKEGCLPLVKYGYLLSGNTTWGP